MLTLYLSGSGLSHMSVVVGPLARPRHAGHAFGRRQAGGSVRPVVRTNAWAIFRYQSAFPIRPTPFDSHNNRLMLRPAYAGVWAVEPGGLEPLSRSSAFATRARHKFFSRCGRNRLAARLCSRQFASSRAAACAAIPF